MPDFVKPLGGMVPERKMTKGELVRALRPDLAAGHEAVPATEANMPEVNS